MEYRAMASNLTGLDGFLRGYLECAEWCGLDEEQREALELSVRPRWSTEAIEQARTDCDAFRRDNASALADWDDSDAGHNFWLTRNRHGAGFWDSNSAHGPALTQAAHVYGEANVDFAEDSETLSFL